MFRHSSIVLIAAVVLVAACRSTYAGEALPTATAMSPVAVTDVPATETSTAVPILQTSEAPTELAADGLSSLEVITSDNWARLQLLKTFPAEMPVSHSAVAISPDGKTMAVGSSEGAQIFFFDLESGHLSRTASVGLPSIGEYFNLGAMEYLADGTIMASSSGPYATYHMDTEGNVLATWDGNTFALSADKSMMAHVDEEGITLVDIADNIPLLSLDDRDALSIAFSPDGSKIAAENVGVDYIHTVVWDIPSRTILSTLEETASPRFSPDGKFLAAIYYDHANDRTPLKIFSPDGGTEITSLNVSGPNDLINSAAVWSVDGSVIVAQVSNDSSTAWDATNWQPLEMPALQGLVSSFSPDGRMLITRTSDGGILLWGVLP